MSISFIITEQPKLFSGLGGLRQALSEALGMPQGASPSGAVRLPAAHAHPRMLPRFFAAR